MTDVVVQYFDGCPNWTVARDRIKTVADDESSVTLGFELIDTFEKAKEVRFRGSPTILIDGVDPFADAGAPVGFACRIYRTEAGNEGSPSIEQLQAVLRGIEG